MFVIVINFIFMMIHKRKDDIIEEETIEKELEVISLQSVRTLYITNSGYIEEINEDESAHKIL